jgi:hypothetical protein
MAKTGTRWLSIHKLLTKVAAEEDEKIQRGCDDISSKIQIKCDFGR